MPTSPADPAALRPARPPVLAMALGAVVLAGVVLLLLAVGLVVLIVAAAVVVLVGLAVLADRVASALRPGRRRRFVTVRTTGVGGPWGSGGPVIDATATEVRADRPPLGGPGPGA